MTMIDHTPKIRDTIAPYRRFRTAGAHLVLKCPLCGEASFHLTIAKSTGKAKGSCFPKAPGGPYCLSYIE